MPAAKATKATAATSFDNALVDVLATLVQRGLEYAENNGAGGVETADLIGRLRAVDADLADGLSGSVERVVSRLAAGIAAARKRIESGTGASYNTQVLVRTHLPIGGVFADLASLRSDAPFHSAVAEAQAEVDKIAGQRDDVLAQLEAAVAAADIDQVMALRPQAEVALPSKLDRAQLALLNARLAAAQAQADNVATADGIASAQAAAAVEAYYEMQRKVEEATARSVAVNIARQEAEQAVNQTAQLVRDLTAERDQLAIDVKDSEQRRFRRLAGLPDPTPEPEADDANETVPLSFVRQEVRV